MYQNFQILPKINRIEIGDVIVIKARNLVGNNMAIIDPRAISAKVITAHKMSWVNTVVVIAAIHEAKPNTANNGARA